MSPSCKLHLRSCLQMYSRVNGNIHGTCKASRTRASPPFPFHSFSRFLLSFLCFPVVFENRTLYARRNDTATTSYRRQNGSRARDCHEFEFVRSGSRSSRGRGILSASSKILSLSLSLSSIDPRENIPHANCIRSRSHFPASVTTLSCHRQIYIFSRYVNMDAV